MGQCYGKSIPTVRDSDGATINSVSDHPLPATPVNVPSVKNTPARSSANSPWPSPYPHGVVGVTPSPARSTPRRFFKRPFPPPSPAKHIKASLARRFGHAKATTPTEGPIPEDGCTAEGTDDQSLDKNFGYNKNFGAKFELGKEIGRGHFGHTCHAKGKKGDLKDLPLAVKIISKAKDMLTMRWSSRLKVIPSFLDIVCIRLDFKEGNSLMLLQVTRLVSPK